MSVANFAEFCSLLAQQDWNEIEIEKIKQTAERRQDYLTRKLDENLCAECKRYNESEVRCKRHGSDQPACIPSGNDISYIVLCWKDLNKLTSADKWIHIVQFLKDHGVKFDTRAYPYESVRKPRRAQTTAYTVFYYKAEDRELTQKDRETCDRLLTLTNKQGVVIKNGKRCKRQKSPPAKRRYRDYRSSEDRSSNGDLPVYISPTPEITPKRYKKDASIDGTVSLFDSPGPSTVVGRAAVVPLQYEKGHFLNGAPPRQYIDAEDAYKIAAQIDFPNTNFAPGELENNWRKKRNNPQVKEEWTKAAYRHNLAVQNQSNK